MLLRPNQLSPEVVLMRSEALSILYDAISMLAPVSESAHLLQVHEKAPHHISDATAGVSTTSGLASSSNSSTGARGGGQVGGRGKGKRGAGGSGGAAQRAIRRRDHWANQLCTPEWMLTVPSDLNGAGSTVGAGEPSLTHVVSERPGGVTLR